MGASLRPDRAVSCNRARRGAPGAFSRLISRRTLLVASLAGGTAAAGLAAASVPWPALSERATRVVVQQLRKAYGLELAVLEPGRLTLWPMPGVRFGHAEIRDGRGKPLADAERLAVDLRLLPLLLGRGEVAALDLTNARLQLEAEPDDARPWDALLSWLRERSGGGPSPASHLQRLSLTGSSLTLRNRRTGFDETVRNITATFSWPAADGPATLSGLAVWRGETVGFRVPGLHPGDLAAGRAGPFEAEANWNGGQLRLKGEAALGEAPRFGGQASFETRSLRDFLGWTGLGIGLGPLVGGLSVEGALAADGDGVSLPSVRLVLGSDRLEGAASAKFEAGRARITATLAADELQLTPYIEPLRHALAPDGTWSAEPIELSRMTEGDVDLRLSANAARLGPLRFDDVAASLLVSPGRIEAAIGRAGLSKGRLKARVTLAEGGEGVEAKVGGSYDRIELGAVLVALGRGRWIAGSAQGQLALEATGASVASLAERTNGRAALTVRSGDLTGISLSEVLRRADKPAAGGQELRGRTPFEQAQVTLVFADGRGEVVDGTLSAPTVNGHLQGRLSLPERTLNAVARLEGAAPSGGQQPVGFDISGPWQRLAVAPERGGGRPPVQGPDEPVGSLR